MTAGDVLREIKRVGLPATVPHIQPPGGRTLVNFDTIFYTDGTVFTRQLTIVGQSVTVEATPTWYLWHFGDGSPTYRTHDKGRPYPAHDITHRYTKGGTYTIDVDVIYQARFRAMGDTWQDIGQPIPVTDGATAPLRAVESVKLLGAS